MKNLTKEDKEKNTVEVFFENNREKININNLNKPREGEDSDIDLIDITNDQKYQIRYLDDELEGKFEAGKKELAHKVPGEDNVFRFGFFGFRTPEKVIEIIKNAIEKKDSYKYPSIQTKDTILLLDGWKLFSILEMSKNFLSIASEDTNNLLNTIKSIKINNFKNIYIVGKYFNLKIK